MTAKFLASMELALPELTEQAFVSAFPLVWTTSLSNSTVVELIPGGRNVPVTLSDATLYIQLSRQRRAQESDLQIEAIREGFHSVVPLSVLKLLRTSELACIIAGVRDWDVNTLMRCAQYQPPSCEHSPVMGYFWQVLKGLTPSLRARFLAWAWGQSQLPDPSSPHFRPIRLMLLQDRDDRTLPTSATCFFLVRLPAYSSRQVLHTQLLFAIENCISIDTDHDAGGDLQWSD
jgi:E3 ubiquitin-protein ligase HERC1